MKKFNIEYQLNNVSVPVLWNSIGTPLGLSEWFADGVTVTGTSFTFVWEKHEQTANLLYTKTNDCIRFQWEEDTDTDNYFELKITTQELTGDITLTVTDFANPDDINDSILLWNHQIEILRRKTGM